MSETLLLPWPDGFETDMLDALSLFVDRKLTRETVTAAVSVAEGVVQRYRYQHLLGQHVQVGFAQIDAKFWMLVIHDGVDRPSWSIALEG